MFLYGSGFLYEFQLTAKSDESESISRKYDYIEEPTKLKTKASLSFNLCSLKIQITFSLRTPIKIKTSILLLVLNYLNNDLTLNQNEL